MKYTDKQYKQALEDIQEAISDLQTSDQIVYMGPLDKALSELDNHIEIEKERYTK